MTTWVALLLADQSPCLRFLVLKNLMNRPDEDPEVVESSHLRLRDPLVIDWLARQNTDGSWRPAAGRQDRGTIMETAQALMGLSYLGFGKTLSAVRRGADYLFSLQKEDGSWPIPGKLEDSERYSNYSMIPLQTAIPLRALAACGYTSDPRVEQAYEWLLAQRLDDGSWPTGLASGVFGRVAGYRRLPQSRWGCRSNTTGALICLAYHPRRRKNEETRLALDHLLNRPTKERDSLGFELSRVLGAEPSRGFLTYYARFDLAQILDLCRRVGATTEDRRVKDLVEFIADAQGPHGLWTYARRPQISRWLSFDLLRSLSDLEKTSEWFSLSPPTPFRPYPKRTSRY